MKLKSTAKNIIFSILLLIFSANAKALSPVAVEGKSFYPACHVCHNQEMDPP